MKEKDKQKGENRFYGRKMKVKIKNIDFLIIIKNQFKLGAR